MGCHLDSGAGWKPALRQVRNLRYSDTGRLRLELFVTRLNHHLSMKRRPDNPGLTRVDHELRASGIRDATCNPKLSGIHSRGYLPHVKREGASYFVTFRLADSLPKEVLGRLEAECAHRLRALAKAKALGEMPSDNEDAIDRDARRALERYLDQGVGACHLRRPEIAGLVADALKFFHQQRYVLRDWVVMPNHVHAIVWPMPNHTLSNILKSWKQFTSLRAKRQLGLKEPHFWQPESYDHWIHDDDEQARIARYIRNNPVRAGLCARAEDWPWSSAYCETQRADGKKSAD